MTDQGHESGLICRREGRKIGADMGTSGGHGVRRSLAGAVRIVIKVGSGVLVDSDQRLDTNRIGRLVESMAQLLAEGRQLVLVTSGAVAAGAPVMGLTGSAKTIPQLQACAAVGQNLLMSVYERFFSRLGRHTAQILLTRDDMHNRERYLNSRNALETLLASGILPVVNENDTVAVNEIKFGDNDHLSAQVAVLVQADLLLILSTVGGFYEQIHDGVPEEGRLIPTVERITDWHFRHTRDTRDSVSINRGGMRSKLQAIRKAADSGIPSLLVSGMDDGILETVLEGREVGTLFLPFKERLSARKHWILHSLQPQGRLVVDRGAARALTQQGKSLLSIGITAVEGKFHSGNPVQVMGPDGREIARGLSYYSSREVKAIRGCKSEEIRAQLGYSYYDEVIHRDNLVLVK